MQSGHRRRPSTAAARAIGVACVVGALAACSSSGHTTAGSTSTTASSTTTSTIPPPTTLPSAASITAVKTWFAAHGKPLIEFERVTDPLATGTLPTPAACLHFYLTDLPRITTNENSLVTLAEQIPNPVLASAVRYDVSTKLLIGIACAEDAHAGRPFPTSENSAASFRGMRAFSQGAHLWLARFGISM